MKTRRSFLRAAITALVATPLLGKMAFGSSTPPPPPPTATSKVSASGPNWGPYLYDGANLFEIGLVNGAMAMRVNGVMV